MTIDNTEDERAARAEHDKIMKDIRVSGFEERLYGVREQTKRLEQVREQARTQADDVIARTIPDLPCVARYVLRADETVEEVENDWTRVFCEGPENADFELRVGEGPGGAPTLYAFTASLRAVLDLGMVYEGLVGVRITDAHADRG